MTVSSINQASQANVAAATSSTSNNLTASTDSFLKLFMAQLQAQDPLDPQSGADMVGQLAQLSTVEQGAQTNQSLASLVAGQQSTSNSGLSNLVGRTVDANAGDFSMQATGGPPPPLHLSATSSMQGANVVITDSSGKTVRTIPIPAGTSSTVQWNGCDANGTPLPPGSYHIAVDAGKSNASITAQWQGAVTAVQLGSGGTQLQMGDVLVNPSDITTIGASS
jgi:flagellar basal-body rod modification protein FlgD|nr:flagellar hook assembly protein FlgD [Kofleriaceae bacterium]